ncbi:MAG: hemolysin family protein [Candidatus Margulisbacteria bacterium]|nr:hemolysin family protein [Candidatus Margulisiibacteriota bacterium]
MAEIILLVVLFVLSAFFSAAETALTSLSRLKVGRMVEQKIKGAKTVEKLKQKPSEWLSTILIGNNLVNIAASAIATSMIISFFTEKGWGSIAVAIGAATGIMTFLILVFGEIIPKTVALRNAEGLALFSAPLIFVLRFIFQPIALLISFISRPFIKLFGGFAPTKGAFVTEEDIRLILAAGQKEGVIEEEEREMITSIFEFGETIVREVMTPRPDITAVDGAKSLSEAIKVIVESGHSRIPIYESNLDNIIGVIYAKDLLRNLDKGKEITGTIKDYLRPAIFIPEVKKVPELMHEMQVARTHVAIIVDEYGMTSGLVTLEDLVEEIVGEIHDEFEREEKMVEKVDENTFVVNGRISIKDLNDALKLNLPEKDKEYDTIGGFIFGQLGKAPSVGNIVRFENLLISVERVLRRRITRVKLVKLPRDLGEEVVGG